MIRAAIFGLGKVVEQIHLPACHVVDEIQVVAGCEPVAERREYMKRRFNLPAVYEDAETMIEAEKPELVIVATPPDSHKDLTLLALNHGSHVLCEKPFMRSVAEADEVIAAAEQQNRLLAVNNQYRYMATYRETQKRLAAGEYGRLFFLQCWQQMFHPGATDATKWRSELKQSTLYEFGSHSLDLISYFFEALPVALNAVMPRSLPQYDSDVLVQMTLHFPDERLATLAFNRVSRAPERYLEMRLDCEKESLRLSLGGVARASLNMNRYQNRVRPTIRFSYVKGGEARAEVGAQSRVIAKEPQSAFASATAAHLRELLTAIRQPTISHERAYHAREILRTIFAGYESNRRRSTVNVSEITA
jgi:predicted dehydrogenase